MGCTQSKKKSKDKPGEKKQKSSHQDEGGRWASPQQDVYLEKQVERLEWQLRTLKDVLSANGDPERAELLKHRPDEEACSLVLSILDKVKAETTADLNAAHEQKSKAATEEHQRLLGGSRFTWRWGDVVRPGGGGDITNTCDDVILLPVCRAAAETPAGEAPAGGGASGGGGGAKGRGRGAGGGATGLPGAAEEGGGVVLQEEPAEEHPGARQPWCILGVRAGVPAVRHRDEERARSGAEQEAAADERPDGEEPDAGGPDGPGAAAERGPPCADRRLPGAHPVRVPHAVSSSSSRPQLLLLTPSAPPPHATRQKTIGHAH
ncbi:coiled-coil domain-containing protein 69 isoform X4 [Antennarius striatus]|uniref:coiled-coil domain-containing protein 69 isoform X4 n=1 Tax=Antennarius striatus TaxID=241820 RepID=UPI0035AE92EE